MFSSRHPASIAKLPERHYSMAEMSVSSTVSATDVRVAYLVIVFNAYEGGGSAATLTPHVVPVVEGHRSLTTLTHSPYSAPHHRQACKPPDSY
jgi:hypothetical protein